MPAVRGQPHKRRAVVFSASPDYGIASAQTIRLSIQSLESTLAALPRAEREKTKDRIRTLRILLESATLRR